MSAIGVEHNYNATIIKLTLTLQMQNVDTTQINVDANSWIADLFK